MANKLFAPDWNNVVYEGRNELVFENRNKGYGAYVLRKNYNKAIVIALIISISVILISVSIPLISAWIKSMQPEPEITIKETEVTLTTPPPINPETPPPPPVTAPPPPPVQQTLKFTPPVVAKDEEVPDEPIATQEELAITNPGTITQEGDPSLDVLPEEIGEGDLLGEEGGIDNKPYLSVQEMPYFPGDKLNDDSRPALTSYISKNIKYPQMERENEIQGQVIVSFVINKEGKVTEAKILKGVTTAIDKEALRVVNSMPSWAPGRQNGHAVNVQFILPIEFTLK